MSKKSQFVRIILWIEVSKHEIRNRSNIVFLVATLDERKKGLGEFNLISFKRENVNKENRKFLKATLMVKCLVAVPLLVAGEQNTM